MGKKVLEYIISAVDRTRGGISAAQNRIKNFVSATTRNLAKLAAGAAVAMTAIAVAARAVSVAVKESFKFEALNVRFRMLLKDIDATREHMKMLKRLGDTPPFSLEQMAAASRSLMVMTGNVLGFEKSLTMMGDAAAATGNSIESVSHAVGRAYAIIRDGQPITRATMELRNMGIITPALAAELDELQKSGASNIEIWDKLEASIMQYEGAMDETLQTGEGLTEALKTEWTNAVRNIGDEFQGLYKDGIGGLLARLREFNESGVIAQWAQGFIDGFDAIISAAKKAWDWMADTWFGKAIKYTADALRNTGVQAGAWLTYAAARATGNDADTAQTAQDIFYAKYAARDESRKKTVERLGFDPSEQDRIMREQGRHVAEMAKAEEKQTAELERQKQIAEERRKVERDMATAEAARQERLRVAAERAAAIAEAQEKLKALGASQGETHARLTQAQQSAQQAWGWFRDPQALREQIREERRDARAEIRFQRQFETLQARIPDWREAEKLSLRDEATRRVALAREEEQAAERFLEEIAENTRDLDEFLKQALMVR